MLITGTSIRLSFIHVDPGAYPPLYYGAGEGSANLGSINPGNSYQLYVGGGGGNQGFHDLLVKTQKKVDLTQEKGEPPPDDYAHRHKALYDKAVAAGTETAFEVYADTDPMAFSYLHAAKVTKSANSYEGICFVDAFAVKQCPKGNPKNATMVYLAPPDGANFALEADFLKAITDSAVNVIRAVAGYNALAGAQGVPAVEVLRSCLYSSAIYNPERPDPNSPGVKKKVDLNKIARAIFAGFASELKAQPGCGIAELQLPTRKQDKDDPLFAAVESDNAPGH